MCVLCSILDQHQNTSTTCKLCFTVCVVLQQFRRTVSPSLSDMTPHPCFLTLSFGVFAQHHRGCGYTICCRPFPAARYSVVGGAVSQQQLKFESAQQWLCASNIKPICAGLAPYIWNSAAGPNDVMRIKGLSCCWGER